MIIFLFSLKLQLQRSNDHTCLKLHKLDIPKVAANLLVATFGLQVGLSSQSHDSRWLIGF
jgi:hypothetical protein